ncbi:phosphate signaling complex protein PhoU [Polymorphobacter fuscus]|uniref:Phosphate-specific transport system accessory protein PhoU n=1 Tax=Sandarakinorhabdus fusca TaxID=1439888 RepID=A0A7C9KJY8_9SPHN|nr:phosphate signaling complex protein PhoU [Polymorphobacter fuscus]KAB7648594.1 phosphate signaling complex protein PhoU [Polymorphobacter fuscus]MQT16143.1 phosphate signaling complex protein PhoU [Polymorphobacter fuscus]NJC07578.1 phosphate transport system protein [Polymorphobacter fuscus]
MADTTAHTVKSFDEDIAQLRSIITRMGGLCEVQISAAVEALVTRNVDAALQVVADDARIDALEAEAEALAVRIIALRAPLAGDLREIVSAMKIAGVLERMGDYAKNIAKRASALAQAPPVEPVVIVPEMARAVIGMIRDVLDAFVDRDVELAQAVCDRDQQVDDFYNSLFRSLLTFMMENPHYITPSTHLLFVAKNLERIGDHATSVAEMVHFTVTGEHIVDRPKTDDTSTFARL